MTNTVTEEEAKEKLCPFSTDVDGVFNRCCASNCMAWQKVIESPYPAPSENNKGYCGLARKS